VRGVLVALEKLHEQVINAMSRSQAFGLVRQGIGGDVRLGWVGKWIEQSPCSIGHLAA
jgi:hypothetical protein